MDQHKLYRTIQVLGEAEFRTEEQLIAHVLEQILKNEEIAIRGARIWRLETSTGAYRLARQYVKWLPLTRLSGSAYWTIRFSCS